LKSATVADFNFAWHLEDIPLHMINVLTYIAPDSLRKRSSSTEINIETLQQLNAAGSTPQTEKKSKLSIPSFFRPTPASPKSQTNIPKSSSTSSLSSVGDSGSWSSPETEREVESPGVPTVSIAERGQEIVKQSQSLLQDVKSSENAKELLDEGKRLISTIKEQEEFKQALHEGKKVLKGVTESEKGQELIKEGKEIIEGIKNNEKFTALKQQGQQLLQSAKNPDMKFDKQQLAQMIAQGKELIKDLEAEHSKGEIKHCILNYRLV
jgi:hypothetical protein